ncbi:MAG: hypothetical protein PHT69_14270 [Bacteroidales bacterium]|nr:hypothetical protein [Bacteroidales bacterium]
MENLNQNTQECCPEFKPELWRDIILEWSNKKFIKDSICTMFYMPLNFGKVMRRMDKKLKKSGASTPDSLCLADHTSMWNMDVYLAVDKDVDDAKNVTLNGKFFSRVYEGNFKDTGIWIKDFEKEAKTRAYTTSKLYMWYTTCPKCAKKYGKNYVVIIGKVENL